MTPEQRKQLLQELSQKQNNGGLKPKDRLAIPPQDMPQQDPGVRRRNVGEVAQGYTEEQARIEAMRCLQCRNAPCVEGCPVRIDIPDFVGAVARGDFDKALEIIKESSLLPAVCGRVCPQEVQCQENCTVGLSLKDVAKAVSIGRLERFVADLEREMRPPRRGPGNREEGRDHRLRPGGIVAAADARSAGHDVTLFEAFHKPGGVMVYGIPEFRLPKAIVQKEIDTLKKMGVEIVTNFIVGRTRTIEQLMKEDGFDAVFIGVGAGLPRFMGIEGESLVGVFSANEYLTRANLMKAYDFGKGADTPIALPGGWPWSAAATSPWTRPAWPCGWAPRRSTSSTAAPRRRCPRGSKKSTTPRKKASTSTCSRTPSASSATRAARHRHRMPALRARRAGRLGPPAARRDQRLRVPDGGRHGHRRHRQPGQPADPPDHPGPGVQQIRQPRRRRAVPDLDAGRLRRRRHRARARPR